MHSRTSLAVLGCVALSLTTATAQETTVYLLQDESLCLDLACHTDPAKLIEVDVDGARIVSTTDVLQEQGRGDLRLTATADGRYLVWSSSSAHRLSAFDRVTGASSVLLQQPVSLPLSGGNFRVVSHPSEVRMFASLRRPPTLQVSAVGISGFDIGGALQRLQCLTTDGRHLLIGRTSPSEAAVVDTATGAIVSRVTGRENAEEWAISPSGDAIYAVTHGTIAGARVTWLTRYDAATGAVLVEREVPFEPALSFELSLYGFQVDPRTGRLWYYIGGGTYRVLDPVTLDLLGVVTTPLPSLPPVESFPGAPVSGRLDFDPHHQRAFLLASRPQSEFFPRGLSRLDVVDTDRLVFLTGGELPTATSEIVVVPRPPAPTALSAEVNGARVTIRWTPGVRPGLATGFRVEAGSGPGLQNLASLNVATDNELVVDAVPSGIYYLRVRGTSWGGASDSSPEIVVTVPARP